MKNLPGQLTCSRYRGLKGAEMFLVIVTVLIGVILVVAFLVQNDRIEADTRRKEAKTKKAAQREIDDRIAAELEEWSAERQAEGWTYITAGKFMHRAGQPRCIMLLSLNTKLLRFDVFGEGDGLTLEPPIYVNINKITSLNVARPKVTKSRSVSVPISITETKQKSPVGRGLLGGALLGPAGLILGAASGLNAKTTQRIENHTTSQSYESLGAPQLIIGTTIPETPVFKMQCANDELADEWMFRIRGAQSSGYDANRKSI